MTASRTAAFQDVIDAVAATGLPNQEQVSVLGEAAILAAIAAGESPGASFTAGVELIAWMRRILDDFLFRRTPFENTGPQDGTPADLGILLLEEAQGLVRLFFSTLEPELRARVLAGRADDEAARELVASTFRQVGGDRQDDEPFTREDLAAVLCKLCRLVLEIHRPGWLSSEVQR